jgi:hypothetical protein
VFSCTGRLVNILKLNMIIIEYLLPGYLPYCRYYPRHTVIRFVSTSAKFGICTVASWAYKRHLLKIKCVHSSLNVNILASTSVPFRPTTVQVPNLADNSAWLNYFMYLIQHYIICRASDSTVSEDAGIEPGLLLLWHLQSDDLTPRLDLVVDQRVDFTVHL